MKRREVLQATLKVCHLCVGIRQEARGELGEALFSADVVQIPLGKGECWISLPIDFQNHKVIWG